MRTLCLRKLLALVCPLLLAAPVVSAAPSPFSLRGYYITFMRMPTLGLPEWRRIIDCIRDDGGNALLLWTGGAFHSKKFPVTWRYNAEHKNVERDFVGELIDYAHTRGVRVLLAFTPFAYDGVNQYALEHPELKATQRDGTPANLWGMHCWGYNLCPARAESRRFMLDYVREMFFEFYPRADGLMIESSDYAICFCAECKERFFEKEFQFVRQISEEVWQAKPDATILVYPHYFSGRQVPGFDVTAARQKFDPRWTLFFTPHSAHLDGELLAQARTSIWWNEGLSLGTPRLIRDGAQKARQFKMTGYMPSLEAYTFRAERAEGGEQWLVGTRLKPFGFGWLRDGQMPFNELLVRVNRVAYREFTRDPDLPDAEFKQLLGGELLGLAAPAQAVEDLLYLQESWFLDRTWFSASPLVTPPFLKERVAKKAVNQARLADYRRRLERIKEIENSYRSAATAGLRELHHVAEWVVDSWRKADTSLLGASQPDGR
jgi:hypothetical protein